MEMKMENIHKKINKVHPEVSLLRISHFLHKKKEKALLATTGKRETLKQVQGGSCFIATQQAFTLIELLVVVLIIGILAAVAVPQYEKTVEKSKGAQALTLLKSLSQAAEDYYMANGTEFSSFDSLAVSVPWPTSARVIGGQESRSNGEWTLEIEDSSASGAVVLFMTRMTGKYKGAGFFVVLFNTTNGHLNKNIRCFERKTAATVLFDTSLAEGSYCQKLFNASLSDDNTWQRSYALP